jgi:drug/metabolite transporter (DMT)-like permease
MAVVVDQPWTLRVEPAAALAVLWLGFLGSGLAYLIFFRLLARRGAGGTSVVAYLLPVFGVALGAMVLNEPVDGRLLLGLALIVGGIATVNARFWRRPGLASPTAPATAAGRRGV